MSAIDDKPPSFTAFAADRLIAHGDLGDVARAVHAAADLQPMVFEDATGRLVDLDLRGSADEAAARVSPQVAPAKPSPSASDKNCRFFCILLSPTIRLEK